VGAPVVAALPSTGARWAAKAGIRAGPAGV